MTDAIKLKPCPFCGGRRIRYGSVRDGRSIGCVDCAVRIVKHYGARPDIVQSLATAWNTRTAPQVKPLVWGDECRKNSSPDRWYAEMPCGSGDYTVAGSTRKNEWRWYRNGRYVVGFYDKEPTTIEAAKAAAQADYTRRILDALA